MFPGFLGGYVSLVVRRIDLLFWQGVPIVRGTLLVDAIEFVLNQVAGAYFLDLARSLCCIKAWQSAAAVMQRIAMPLEILGVLVTWFCHRQALWLERGLRFYMAFVCYLRPREEELDICLVACLSHLFRLWTSWLHPRERAIPGKTRLFSDHVALDEFSEKVSAERTLGLVASSMFLRNDPPNFVNNFKAAVGALKLANTGISLYCLRHGKAAFDLVRQLPPHASMSGLEVLRMLPLILSRTQAVPRPPNL